MNPLVDNPLVLKQLFRISKSPLVENPFLVMLPRRLRHSALALGQSARRQRRMPLCSSRGRPPKAFRSLQKVRPSTLEAHDSTVTSLPRRWRTSGNILFHQPRRTCFCPASRRPSKHYWLRADKADFKMLSSACNLRHHC